MYGLRFVVTRNCGFQTTVCQKTPPTALLSKGNPPRCVVSTLCLDDSLMCFAPLGCGDSGNAAPRAHCSSPWCFSSNLLPEPADISNKVCSTGNSSAACPAQYVGRKNPESHSGTAPFALRARPRQNDCYDTGVVAFFCHQMPVTGFL